MTSADAARAARGLGPLSARSLAVAALWLRRVMSVVFAVSLPSVRVVLGAAGDVAKYRAGRWHASLGWAGLVWLGLLAANGDLVTAVVLVSCGPAVVAGVWRRVWPVSFERVAAPVRRLVWWVWVRRRWAALARDCGLSVQRKRRQRGIAWQSKKAKSGGLTITQASDATEWVAPKLRKVTTAGDTLTLTVRTRAGQHSDDLEKAAPALAATCGAISHRVRVLSPFTVRVELVMREALASLRLAVPPAAEGAAGTAGDVAGLVALTNGVQLGRRQDGSGWLLRVRGRHTLVVGCSGSGKGSLLWGIAAGLAPAVSADVVRLWGIDLKRGVEIAFGEGLFTTTAYTRTDALAVLRRLVDVIAERGDQMAGRVRLHQPRPGDPLHVLVIDELATLTAYGDKAEREEANRLLAEIQSQGRALGVVVVAFVQDPRKDTVPTRSLFTQTVALRLRSASEVTMVLGDGIAALAPAHRVSPAAPGTGYLVDEDGTVDRVRADFWPDDLVRHVAARHPSPLREAVPAPADARRTGQDAHDGQNGLGASVVDIADLSRATRKPRTPRSPRKPRAPRPDRTQART